MFLLEVTPIARGVLKDSLTYFSLQKAEPGQLVKVPVRGRVVSALVTSVRLAAAARTEIRTADFALRKIEKLHASELVLPSFVRAAGKTARFFAGHTGAVLSTFIPAAVLESPSTYHSESKVGSKAKKEEDTKSELNTKEDAIPLHKARELHSELQGLQAPSSERIAAYKSLIRESFARGQSVFMCFPTIAEIQDMLDPLSRGIEEYSFVLHGALPKKELLNSIRHALKKKHPVLIMGTGLFLSIPRRDFGVLILERAGSHFYHAETRPYVDVRVFAEYWAREAGARFIVADTVLPIEYLYRHERGELTEFHSLKFRLPSPAQSELVDMRQSASGEKRPFEILGRELRELLTRNKEEESRLLLFAARTGLSPQTICEDCSSAVLCERCSAPVTLHTRGGGRLFVCHHCGRDRAAEDQCKTCGSWRLKTLGIGTELVAEELKKLFPKTEVFRLDRSNVHSEKDAQAIIKKFLTTRGAVLLSTELALFYLYQNIEHVAVVSLDALFSIPDFRMNERVFSLTTALRLLASQTFLLQSRNVESRSLLCASRGNIIDFYREELEKRRAFNYPPFSILIKLSLEGRSDIIAREMDSIIKQLSPFEVSVFPAFIAGAKGKKILHGLISIPAEEWPHNELIKRLRILAPSVKVQVAPGSAI